MLIVVNVNVVMDGGGQGTVGSTASGRDIHRLYHRCSRLAFFPHTSSAFTSSALGCMVDFAMEFALQSSHRHVLPVVLKS
jgi:hypothetical protein